MNSELTPYFNSEKVPLITVFFDGTLFYNSIISEPAASDIRDLFTKFNMDPLIN
jgi:hypothetical protein